MTTSHVLRIPVMLQRALLRALEHDCLNLGQSAAYSAMVSLFPALIVSAAFIAFLPDVASLKQEIGEFFNQVLPADVFPLLTGYFAATSKAHTTRALILAGIVSLTGASSIIATLMEGLRRAEDLPVSCWTFAQRRIRAFLLVPVCLLPLVLATVLVVFGQLITTVIAAHLFPVAQSAFYGLALAIRWMIALGGVSALTASIYHLGVPTRRDWQRTVPGAIVATILWFVITLIFGWYVTRFANYSQIYGSLGAGIALLFWLYIVFLSVLVGAEFNVQFAHHFYSEEPTLMPVTDTGTQTNPLG